MEFKRLIYNDIFYGFYKIDKLSNRQSIGIFFTEYSTGKRSYYNVAMAIANKRKYILDWILDNYSFENKSTGKCGLEGLVWAKKRLIEFEKSEHVRIGDVIEISWSDNRRRDAYEHALKKIGYEIKYIPYKCLCKTITE